jgi:hypothetical protein
MLREGDSRLEEEERRGGHEKKAVEKIFFLYSLRQLYYLALSRLI